MQIHMLESAVSGAGSGSIRGKMNISDKQKSRFPGIGL